MPPDARQAPFASDPEQVEAAVEGDMLILATPVLYQALRDVAPEALRSALVRATGRFDPFGAQSTVA